MASSPSEDSSSTSITTTVSGHDHENHLTTSGCKHPLQKIFDFGGDFIRKIMCPVNGVLRIVMERLKIEEEEEEQTKIEKTEAHLDANMDEGKSSDNQLVSAAAFVEGGIQDECDNACSICLEAFSYCEPSTSTACKHEYHLQCILEWCQRSSQCPMCWQPISLNDLSGNRLMTFLQERLNREQDTRLYATVMVTRDEDIRRQVGWDLFFDLVDHDKVRSFRVQKLMPFNVFKEEVARELGIPVQFQRFWLWARRINGTYRPDRPLTVPEEAETVGHICELRNACELQNAVHELKLFLEVEFGLDMRPIAFPSKEKDDILLFFKLYDPEKGELRYVGRLFVKQTSKPIDILAKLNAMSGFAADEEIDLYEEIFFQPKIMCEPVDKRRTFGYSELGDGDIICFQKSVSTQRDQLFLADVPSFYEYLT